VWNYHKGNRILIIIKIFGRHKLVPTLHSGKVWQIWCLAIFLSILLPLSRNLTPSLRTTSYVHESRRWQTVPLSCTIGISMYQKHILPYVIIPSTFSPQASSPLSHHRQTEKILHPLLPKLFFSTERAGPYPQAQLYWAGQTMGWMADWTKLKPGWILL
jgi:hypothetical protein